MSRFRFKLCSTKDDIWSAGPCEEAVQWHPDKNPTNQEEAVKKFQVGCATACPTLARSACRSPHVTLSHLHLVWFEPPRPGGVLLL